MTTFPVIFKFKYSCSEVIGWGKIMGSLWPFTEKSNKAI